MRIGPFDFRREERNVGSLNARKMELLRDEDNNNHYAKMIIREMNTKRLANTVACALPSLVLFGEKSERPTINRNILSCSEEIEDEKAQGQKMNVGSFVIYG